MNGKAFLDLGCLENNPYKYKSPAPLPVIDIGPVNYEAQLQMLVQATKTLPCCTGVPPAAMASAIKGMH